MGRAADGHGRLVSPDDHTRISLEEIYADEGLLAACSEHQIGASERELLTEGGSVPSYGETDIEPVVSVLEAVLGRTVSCDDCFYDLGSGSARLVLSAALFTPVRKSVGIELSLTRHEQAERARALASSRGLLGPSSDAGKLELCYGSLLEHPLADATLVFCFLIGTGAGFQWQQKRHLLTTVPRGAALLLRGQRLPMAEGARSFLRDQSSWSVRLLAASTAAPAVVRARVRRLEPRVVTEISNRMFQFFGYVLREDELSLSLLAEANPGEDAPSRPEAQSSRPVPADASTAAAMEADRRIGAALARWIEGECEAFERAGGCRTLTYEQRQVRLGQTRFERAILLPAGADDDEEAAYVLPPLFS